MSDINLSVTDDQTELNITIEHPLPLEALGLAEDLHQAVYAVLVKRETDRQRPVLMVTKDGHD